MKQFNFNNDGFVIFEQAIDKIKLKKAQQALFELTQLRYEKEFNEKISISSNSSLDEIILKLDSINPSHRGFIYDTISHLPEFHNLLNDDYIVSKIRTTLNINNLVSVINLNIRIDLPSIEWKHNKTWHQDYPYENPFYVKNSSLVAWFPLFDCPLKCGPVVLKAGSHVLGEVSHIPIERKPGQTPDWTMDEKFINDKSFEEIQLPLKAGDLILFDMYTLHKSGINTSKNKIRWSVTSRFSNVFSNDFLEKYSE